MKNGNFNCRYREKIIVVDQFTLFITITIFLQDVLCVKRANGGHKARRLFAVALNALVSQILFSVTSSTIGYDQIHDLLSMSEFFYYFLQKQQLYL